MRKELKKVAIIAIIDDLPVKFEGDRVIVGTPSNYVRVTYDEETGYYIRWNGLCEDVTLARVMDIIRLIKSQN